MELAGIYVSLPRPLSLVYRSNSQEVLAELSTCGWLYNYGKALGEDLRMKITQDIVGKERDFTTGFFLGSFSVIARENRAKYFESVFFHCCGRSSTP